MDVDTAAEKIRRQNHNIKSVVCDSFGCSVALERQKQHPELVTRVYGTPAVVPTCMSRTTNVDTYRNEWDLISISGG
jgi:hypothetical protein